MILKDSCRTCYKLWPFLAILALLTFAILGVCTKFCRAAEDNAASMVLRYEVDTSRLPPKTKIDMRSLILAIKDRLPTDAKVRHFGETGIEVTADKKDQAELNLLRRRITTNGPISFNRFIIGTDPNARRVIDAALDVPSTKSEVTLNGQSTAKWVPVYSRDFDPNFLLDSNVVTRINNSLTELLVWNDLELLTGDYLLSAKKKSDDKGSLGLEFEFSKDGAKLLRRMTTNDSEEEVSKHVLGLFIDDRVYSGTIVEKQLDSKLFIGSLPEYEIDGILSILNAGSLPYPLKEQK
jgi:hypothetical protein